MRTLHIILLVCQIVVAIQARTVFKFSKEWQVWKAEHGKLYSSELEELEKHLVWLSNKKYIEAHNAASDVFGYTLELNKFADMVRQTDITFVYNIFNYELDMYISFIHLHVLYMAHFVAPMYTLSLTILILCRHRLNTSPYIRGVLWMKQM